MCIQKEENKIPFVKIKKNAWKIQVGLGCKDFPAGSDSKESTCNAGDPDSILGSTEITGSMGSHRIGHD